MSDPKQLLLTKPKGHSDEADALDFLCRKMSDVRVRSKISTLSGKPDDDLRLCDVV